MALKQADRSATFTFCQNAPFFAAGSVAGAIDLSFSTSSQLEVRLGTADFSFDCHYGVRVFVVIPIFRPRNEKHNILFMLVD